MNLTTPEVAAALNSINTNDRKVVYIFSTMASSGLVQCDSEDVVMCKVPSGGHCEVFGAGLKAAFDPLVPLILHCGGEIMDDCTGSGRKRVERLPAVRME